MNDTSAVVAAALDRGAGGRIAADALRTIGATAAELADGDAQLASRANLQLRGDAATVITAERGGFEQ